MQMMPLIAKALSSDDDNDFHVHLLSLLILSIVFETKKYTSALSFFLGESIQGYSRKNKSRKSSNVPPCPCRESSQFKGTVGRIRVGRSVSTALAFTLAKFL